jgi:hypothetical protein
LLIDLADVCDWRGRTAKKLFLGYPTIAQGDPIVISSGAIVGHASDSSLTIGVQQPGLTFLSTPIGGFSPISARAPLVSMLALCPRPL